MSKGLSNGLMSLRFMQNAQRAKQQAQIDAEQAKVKDEAEWEVSQEVKDSWGIGKLAAEAETSKITHEASYIPFMFSSSPSGNSFSDKKYLGSDEGVVAPSTITGRRAFDHGREIIPEPLAELKATAEEIVSISNIDNSKVKSGSSKRPTSISGFKAPLITKQKNTGRTKTAQMLIQEDNSLKGISSRAEVSQPIVSSSGPTTTSFLRPSGVDSPLPDVNKTQGRSGSTKAPKRARETVEEGTPGAENKKKKKKKAISSSS
ncbi:hypothetical protein ABKN59_004449 [Abortiporus biennis]